MATPATGAFKIFWVLLEVEKNPIPARLSLDEQGVFVLGYYHQRAAFYVKNTASPEAVTTESH